jgi:hypothetical protein
VGPTLGLISSTGLEPITCNLTFGGNIFVPLVNPLLLAVTALTLLKPGVFDFLFFYPTVYVCIFNLIIGNGIFILLHMGPYLDEETLHVYPLGIGHSTLLGADKCQRLETRNTASYVTVLLGENATRSIAPARQDSSMRRERFTSLVLMTLVTLMPLPVMAFLTGLTPSTWRCRTTEGRCESRGEADHQEPLQPPPIGVQ